MTDMNPSPAPSGASAAAEKPAAAGRLLGAADIRHIAAEAGISPTKKFGQNFVIDPGTVRRIVREAAVTADTRVLEVGPGLGSLTLAILETGATMTAVEIDPPVAQRLPHTIDTYMPDARNRLTVINKDALALTSADLPEFSGDEPFTLVANLPYNVATPIILTLLERFDMLTSFVVMVQKEVADRLTATPGSSAERGFGPGRVHPCPVACGPARPPVAPADVPVGRRGLQPASQNAACRTQAHGAR